MVLKYIISGLCDLLIYLGTAIQGAIVYNTIVVNHGVVSPLSIGSLIFCIFLAIAAVVRTAAAMIATAIDNEK